MSIINWQQFGIKKNPYDVLPLIEGGDISIEKAFVGRVRERKFLEDLFASESRVCLTICGNIGVGKTSLANFHKFIWKYYKEDKRLFSFRREIEISEKMLDKRSFLIEIIGSILREIQLIDPEIMKKFDLLKRANQVVDISQSLSFTAGLSGGFAGWQLGGDFGRDSASSQPVQFPITTLEQYFSSLLGFIRTEKIAQKIFTGLIVHVNNFEVVCNNKENKKKVIQFFHEIRDLLQTPHVYFLFLGPKNFFREIINSQQRVKSVFFQTPLIMVPLTKIEIIQAFEERMKLLKSDNVVEYIKPFEDEVIFKLYDLFEGDIRSIMAALRDILNQYSDKLARTLSIDEAMILLANERWDRIEAMSQLTEEQKKIPAYFAQSKLFISQKDIAEILHKLQSNISGYY
ncbi:hypothetical protein KKF69_06225, partial [Patescibacteria group bacterium]|nr:hypothetical protein [Patescibacteria group bacterium]